MNKVRVTGDSTQRIELDGEFKFDGTPYRFAVWRVEVLDDDGKWQLVTACVGPASKMCAEAIADLCGSGCLLLAEA